MCAKFMSICQTVKRFTCISQGKVSFMMWVNTCTTQYEVQAHHISIPTGFSPWRPSVTGNGMWLASMNLGMTPTHGFPHLCQLSGKFGLKKCHTSSAGNNFEHETEPLFWKLTCDGVIILCWTESITDSKYVMFAMSWRRSFKLLQIWHIVEVFEWNAKVTISFAWKYHFHHFFNFHGTVLNPFSTSSFCPSRKTCLWCAHCQVPQVLSSLPFLNTWWLGPILVRSPLVQVRNSSSS